jgi:hypothetical protein
MRAGDGVREYQEDKVLKKRKRKRNAWIFVDQLTLVTSLR